MPYREACDSDGWSGQMVRERERERERDRERERERDRDRDRESRDSNLSAWFKDWLVGWLSCFTAY